MTHDDETPEHNPKPGSSPPARKPNRAERRRQALLDGTLVRRDPSAPAPESKTPTPRQRPPVADVGQDSPGRGGIDPWARARDKIRAGKPSGEFNTDPRDGARGPGGPETRHPGPKPKSFGPSERRVGNSGFFDRNQQGADPRFRRDAEPFRGPSAQPFRGKAADGGWAEGLRDPKRDRGTGATKPSFPPDRSRRFEDGDRRGSFLPPDGDNRAFSRRSGRLPERPQQREGGPDDRRGGGRFGGENRRFDAPELRVGPAGPERDRFGRPPFDEEGRRGPRRNDGAQPGADRRFGGNPYGEPRRQDRDAPRDGRSGRAPAEPFTRNREMGPSPTQNRTFGTRNESPGGSKRRPDAGDRPFTKRSSPSFHLPSSDRPSSGDTGFARRTPFTNPPGGRFVDQGPPSGGFSRGAEPQPPRTAGPTFRRGAGSGRQHGGKKMGSGPGRWDDSSDGERSDPTSFLAQDQGGHDDAAQHVAFSPRPPSHKRRMGDSPEPTLGQTTNRWEQRGKLSIAIRTTHRLGVADAVKPSDSPEETGSPSLESSRLLRIPAAKRARIHVDQEPHFEPEPAQPAARRPRALPLQVEGRSATAEDDELRRLIREEESLKALQVPLDVFVETLGKLPDIEQERWLGLRNGMVRVLRPRLLLDAEAVKNVLDGFRQTTGMGTPNPSVAGIVERAIRRAESLLEQDPLALWNLSAAAMLPVFLENCGADDRSWVEQLPEGEALPFPWPVFAAAPMFAEVGRWRVERLLGNADADGRFAERTKKAAARMFPQPLRVTIGKLVQSMDGAVLDSDDEAGWSAVALKLLRQAATSGDDRVRALVGRPLEPSGYVALGKRLLKQGLAYMAQQSLLVATMLQADHQAAQVALSEATDLAAQTASTMSLFETEAGVGQLIATTDPETPFVGRWKPFSAGFLNASGLHRLGLPPAVESALIQAGLSTVAQVRNANAEELIRIGGIGPREMLWIREALRSKSDLDE